MAISRLSIIKFIELAIAATCIGLHYKSALAKNLDTEILTVTAFGGFIIVLVGVFAGHLMGTPINKKIDIFYCLLGCALFVAAGAVNIDFFKDMGNSEYKRYGLAKGSMAIIGGAVFLVDSLLTWRGDY